MLTVTPLRRFTSETAAVTGMKCHDQSRRDKAGRGRLLTRGTHRLRIAPKLCWHKAGGSGPSRMCGCHNTRFFFKRWYSSSREKQCSVHLSTPQRKEIKDPGTHKEKDFCSFCVIYNFHTVPVRESVNRECLKGKRYFSSSVVGLFIWFKCIRGRMHTTDARIGSDNLDFRLQADINGASRTSKHQRAPRNWSPAQPVSDDLLWWWRMLPRLN